jgi:hypothetical protein
MPGLRDPAIGLSCDETPFYPPRTAKISDISVCESCTLTFNAPIAGTKMFSPRFGFDGIWVDESPLTELTYNTTKYALFNTTIWKKGAHRNFNTAETYDLEMNLYFRDVFDPFKQIAVAIPITIDNAKANPYFTEMANQNGSVRMYSLEKIISEGPVIMYKGVSLSNRNSTNPFGAEQCRSSASLFSLTWFILQTAYISSSDANRIRNTELSSNVLPPVPQHELTLERTRSMASVISTIEVKKSSKNTEKTSTTKADKGIYLTRALQCQRINPATDIKNNAVYLNDNKQPKTSLQDELNIIATDSNVPLGNSGKGGIRPKQIEEGIAIFIGIIIGIILFFILAHFILQILYKGYLPSVTKMEVAMPVIIDAKTAACAQYTGPKLS